MPVIVRAKSLFYETLHDIKLDSNVVKWTEFDLREDSVSSIDNRFNLDGVTKPREKKFINYQLSSEGHWPID